MDNKRIWEFFEWAQREFEGQIFPLVAPTMAILREVILDPLCYLLKEKDIPFTLQMYSQRLEVGSNTYMGYVASRPEDAYRLYGIRPGGVLVVCVRQISPDVLEMLEYRCSRVKGSKVWYI